MTFLRTSLRRPHASVVFASGVLLSAALSAQGQAPAPPAAIGPRGARLRRRPGADRPGLSGSPQAGFEQSLWVETEFDSDGDGKRDRVFVDVTRPQQTDTEGLKVPVIYESSPYFAGTSGDRKFLWNVNQELGAQPPPRTSQPEIEFRPTRTSVSNSQVKTWVPRGFAVVHSDAPGHGTFAGLRDGGRRAGTFSRRRPSSIG